MAESSLSFVGLSSLNAKRPFWDQIFEVRRYIDSHCSSDIWTEQKRKQVCGQLDAEEMKDVLEAMLQKGRDIVDANETKLTKILIDVKDDSGLIKILMSLKYPNEVFNTAGNYESYMNEDSIYLSSSYAEFAQKIQGYGDAKFETIWENILEKFNSADQSDWNEATTTSPAYIKNKPGFASKSSFGLVKIASEGNSILTVNDGIISVSNLATHSYHGLMSKEDKSKLDGISAGANYTGTLPIVVNSDTSVISVKAASTSELGVARFDNNQFNVSSGFVTRKPIVVNVSLTTEWTTRAARPFTCAGITTSDHPFVELVQSNNVEAAILELAEWAKVSRIWVSADNTISVNCYNAVPNRALTIKVVW